MPLDGYVSPLLRMAVFRRLNPIFQMGFTVLPIGEAFPANSVEAEEGCPKPPTHAVVCEIVFPDGSFISAPREIDLCELGRDRKWHDILQTPENMAKVETKAMGRAMTRAGIPQKDAELQTLMRWTVALDGRPIQREAPPAPRGVDLATGEITDPAAFASRPTPDEVDHPDADDDTVTPGQELALRFQELAGPSKAKTAKYARDELGVANVMNAPPDHIPAINTYIDSLSLEEA